MAKNPALFLSIGVRGLEGFDRDMKKMNKSLKRGAAEMGQAGKDLSLGISAPLIGLGKMAISAATEFNAAMRNIGTYIPGNVERVNELKAAIRSAALDTGKDAKDLAAGMAGILGEWGDTSETVALFRANLKLAEGAQTDMAKAIALTDVISSAYNLTTGKQIEGVADLALRAKQLGVNFEGMTGSMTTLAPAASAVGIGMEELFAIYTTLVQKTGDEAVVTSQLKGIFNTLVKPTGKAAKAIKELGLETGQELVASKGFLGALKILTPAMDENGEGGEALVKSANSVVGALTLTGKGAAALVENMKEMANAGGTADKMLKDLEEGVDAPGRAWAKFKAQLKEVLLVLGDELLAAAPLVMGSLLEIAKGISSVAKWFAGLDDGTQKAILKFVLFVAAMGPVMLWASKLVGVLRAVTVGIGLLSKALLFLCMNPVAAVVVGIIGLGLVVYKFRDDIWAALKEVGKAFEWVFEKSVGALKATGAWIKENWKTILFAVLAPGAFVATEIIKHWDGISAAAKAVYEGVKRWLVDKFFWIVDEVGKIAGKVKGFFVKLKDDLVGHSVVPDLAKGIEKNMREIRRSLGTIEPELKTLAKGFASEGDNISESTKELAMSFGTIDERVRAIGEAIELVKAISPQFADALDEDFKRVKETLEATRPYVDRITANFKVMRDAVGGELGLLAEKAKTTRNELKLSWALPMQTGESKRSVWPNVGKEIKEFSKGLREALEISLEDWSGGLAERFDDILNMVDGWRSSFTDAIASALTTGKLNFSDFVNGVLYDIARLLTQVLIVQPIFEGFAAALRGVGGGGGGAGTGVMWPGGGGGGFKLGGGASTSRISASVPAPSMNVSIIDQRSTSAAPLEVTEKTSGGEKQIRVVIREMVSAELDAGGLDKSFRNALSRTGIRRIGGIAR